jgi:hypothetical protein
MPPLAQTQPLTVDETFLHWPWAVAALVVMVVLVAAGLVLGKLRQRTDRRRFLELADELSLEIVRRPDELEQVAQRVRRVFRGMEMYTRRLKLSGVMRDRLDGMVVEVTHVVMGMERSNAQHHTFDKVVVLVHGLSDRLPTFKLMPNNALFKQVHRRPVFAHSSPFGRRNLVLGEDRLVVQHVLGPEVRTMLQSNRELCIDSRDGLIAAYLHDERVQPADLPAFVDRTVALAQAMSERAEHYVADPLQQLREAMAAPG